MATPTGGAKPNPQLIYHTLNAYQNTAALRAAIELDVDVARLHRRMARTCRPGVHVLRRLHRRIFEHASFDAAAPEVLVHTVRTADGHGDRDAVLLREEDGQEVGLHLRDVTDLGDIRLQAPVFLSGAGDGHAHLVTLAGADLGDDRGSAPFGITDRLLEAPGLLRAV